jgi:UDP-GlcNAc:undecaprenyl-phosphate GlcNAc-1-phosphate transferase
MNFLVPYCVLILISSCLAALLTPLMRSLALHIGAVDHPSVRKIHKTPTPRLGGVSVVLAGTLTVVAVLGLDQVLGRLIGLNPGVWSSVLPGGGIILLVGIWDDLRPVRAGVKFCCIAIGAGIALWLGIRLESVSLFGSSIMNLGVLSLPLTFLWIVGITNAFNLVDGLDGLAAGLAIIAAGTSAAILLLHGDIQTSLLLAILLGALLGFLPYNFNPATIFLGDCGSLVIGYTLAVTSVITVQKRATALAIVTPLLVFGLPMIDTLLSMARRLIGRLQVLQSIKAPLKEKIRGAKSMFEPDQRHIHHRLLALGFSHRNAVLFLYALALGLSSMALLAVLAHHRNTGIILITVGLATYIGIRKLGYDEIAFLRTGTLLRWYESLTFNRLFFVGFIDMTLTTAAYWGAFELHYDLPWRTELKAWYMGTFPLVLVVQLACLYALGLYRGVWRAVAICDLIRVVAVVPLAVTMSYIVAVVSLPPVETLRFFLLDALLLSSLMVGVRSTYRVLDYMQQCAHVTGEATLIYGAGRGGQLVLRELRQNPDLGLRPMGFVDDDPRLQGRVVHGIPVLGSITGLRSIIETQPISRLIVSSSKIKRDRLGQALSLCQEWRIPMLQAHLKLEPVTVELGWVNGVQRPAHTGQETPHSAL